MSKCKCEEYERMLKYIQMERLVNGKGIGDTIFDYCEQALNEKIDPEDTEAYNPLEHGHKTKKIKACSTCRYFNRLGSQTPCNNCLEGFGRWEEGEKAL